jgi:hypothetical protein
MTFFQSGNLLRAEHFEMKRFRFFCLWYSNFEFEMSGLLWLLEPGRFVSHKHLPMFNLSPMDPQITAPLHPYSGLISPVIETRTETLRRISTLWGMNPEFYSYPKRLSGADFGRFFCNIYWIVNHIIQKAD